MKNKLFLATLAMSVAVPAVVAPVQVGAESKDFKDLSTVYPQDKEKISTLVGMGVIKGYTDGTFRPNATVTRGQFAEFIARALDLPEPSKKANFKDVSLQVATHDGIWKAYEAGIVEGYGGGLFRPYEEISRSDMAIMLDRALQLQGKYNSKANLNYTDVNKIGKNSKEAVERLTYYGIMGASAKQNFEPEKKGTRLGTVVSIYELLSVTDLLEDTGKEDIKPEEPKPEEPKPVEPPVVDEGKEITKTVKGFVFTYDELNKIWIDEIGVNYREIPKYDEKNAVTPNTMFYINKNLSDMMLYSQAQSYIINQGGKLEKDDFIGAVKQVQKTGKKVVVKGVAFTVVVDGMNEFIMVKYV